MRLKLTSSEAALITDNMVTTFTYIGMFKQDNIPISPIHLNGCIPVRVVSTITSNNFTEIAAFDENDKMTVYQPTDGHGTNAVAMADKLGCYIRRLMKTGEINGVKYTQFIFVYSTDSNVNNIASLMAKA